MQNTSETEISHKIYLIRGFRVMLDRDLAGLYDVETRILNQAVRRNSARFPPDFMFQLSDIEENSLRSQFVISKNPGRGGKRYPATVFTELGIAMLSSVLSSEQAVQTNIRIMRTFFELRKLMIRDPELTQKVGKLEKESNYLFEVIFRRLDEIEIKIPILPPDRKKIGF